MSDEIATMPETAEAGVKAYEPTITQGPAPPLKDRLRQLHNKLWDFYREAQDAKPGPDIIGMDLFKAMGRGATTDTRWEAEWTTTYKRAFATHIEIIIKECREAGVKVVFPDP